MLLVFLGPPGCGKGTQSQYLTEKYGFKSFATGQILRHEIDSASEIGLKIKDNMKAGLYVSDEIILDIIKKNLVYCEVKDVLFDGFPRTLGQAQAFDEFLAQQSKSVDLVVYFSITDHILLKRIVGRYNCADCGRVYHDQTNKPQVEGICDQCRGKKFVRRIDDTAESFEKRLKVYYDSTQPLIGFYKNKSNFVEIDASQNLEHVTERLLTVVQPYLSHDKE
jgi:adenylate kinase